MLNSVDQSTWGPDLDRFEDLMRRLHARAALGSRSLGVPEWDGALWRIGREWLNAHTDAVQASIASDSESQQSDVYLATQVDSIGGHTALIGDFVSALDDSSAQGPEGASSHLILTDRGQSPSPIPDAILSRLRLPPAHITVLNGSSLLDRLHQLFFHLLRLRPRRLFLFQHPHDPLVSVVAQPEIARQRILVHHADSTPSFGMHLPGVQIVDLNPIAAGMTRLQGRVPALLPLTAPDPGPRPHKFLTHGRLVTATSGSPHKFSSRYVLSYAETVRVILRSTGGRHVHIGPLYDETRSQIASALHRDHLALDQFVHVPWTSSVAGTLWEHACDLYLASFPVDGARTKVEVLASATPYLGHATRPDEETARADDPSRDADGGLTWRTWEDLSAALQRMSNAAALAEQAALMRHVYERTHHPRVFAETLARILENGRGADEGETRDRADRAIQSMVRSVTACLIHDADVAVFVRAAHDGLSQIVQTLATEMPRIDAAHRALSQVLERLVIETQRIDTLQEDRRRLAQEVERLQAEQDRWREGRGARARFRHWLMRS